MLAGACSGAVLLGEAGLLTNCDATTHWGYVSSFTNNYPGVKINLRQSLVLSGKAQRIVTAGGGSSWQDLALYLIARFVGLKEAIEVARVYMLQWHDLGQQPFAALMYFRQTQDAIINKCQEWVAQNYRLPSPVAAMIEVSGLAERTFMRRFANATGMTPWTMYMPIGSRKPSRCWKQVIFRWKPSPTRWAMKIRVSSAVFSAARSA